MEGYPVDELNLYLGEDITIADGIVLRCPKIIDILEYGESSYFAMAQTLCATPSSMKVVLDDKGLDYMKITDFQLFSILIKTLSKDITHPLLGDLDLSSFSLHKYGEDDVALCNEDKTIIITEIVYDALVTHIRKMHNFKKQVDKAGNEITRKVLIAKDRKEAERNKNKPYKSTLKPIISAVKCRMGYSMDYIKGMSIFEIMNDLSRLNVIVQADAALGGMYSGFVDTKKMDKTVLDWTRDITEESNKKNKTILKEGAN